MYLIITRNSINTSIDGVSSANRYRLWARPQTTDNLQLRASSHKRSPTEISEAVVASGEARIWSSSEVILQLKILHLKKLPLKKPNTSDFQPTMTPDSDYSVLNLWAKSQFKSPCNHEMPTPISHRRAEVTCGEKRVQHDTASTTVTCSHTCHSSASQTM